MAHGSSIPDHSYIQFYGDDFLRLLMLRFCFCCVVLRLHRSFRGPRFYPTCHPPMPEAEVLDHPALHKVVLDLATLLDCRSLFAEAGEYAGAMKTKATSICAQFEEN